MIPTYSHQQLIDAARFSIQDKNKMATYRGAHNRLGFAYQLAFTRLFNFLPSQHPLQVIDELLTFVALQLEIDKKLISQYSKYQQHISRHQKQIGNISDKKSKRYGQFDLFFMPFDKWKQASSCSK